MELWFSENHTPDVKLSLRLDRHLYSAQSDYQQIAALAETLAERKAELDTLYQQWEKAEETLAAFTEE